MNFFPSSSPPPDVTHNISLLQDVLANPRFISGDINCDVFETVPNGYQQSYAASGDSLSDSDLDGCYFTDVDGGDENLCAITNTLLPVDVTVNKEWIDDNPGFNYPTLVEITFSCNADIVGDCTDVDGICGIEGGDDSVLTNLVRFFVD